MDEEEVFEDTVSVTSEPSKRDKEYISLSRFTVYHSAEDIPLEEQEEADGDKAVTEENCRLMDKPAQFNTSDAEDKVTPRMVP